MKILVLGHKGMLGRTIMRFFSKETDFDLVTVDTRWGTTGFEKEVMNTSVDFIINCIGKIPQKQPEVEAYNFLNIELPRFLETIGAFVIHPSTDSEFKGDIPIGHSYSKSSTGDADSVYGKSKATIAREIVNNFKNTKIIRTSIIGHEENTHVSLLDWFLSQTGSTKGYTNHYWNGITTLEWAKQCYKLINDWQNFPTLNQLSTKTHYSKFDILCLAKEIYKKDIEVIPYATELTVNKCLESDKVLPELKEQLIELKIFFDK